MKIDRNEALDLVEQFHYQRHKEGKSQRWFKEKIEDLEFFSEEEIWEFLEVYRG